MFNRIFVVVVGALIAVGGSISVPSANAEETAVPAGSTWRVYGQYTGGCATIQRLGPNGVTNESGCRSDGWIVKEWQVTAEPGEFFGVRVVANGAEVIDCAISEGEGVEPIVHQSSQDGQTIECRAEVGQS